MTATPSPTAAPPFAGLRDFAIRLLVRFFRRDWSGALLALVVLAVAIEMVTTGRSFFHPSNLLTILNNSAAIGVIAAGMTLVILTGGIDLSVGSVMGMTAALTGYIVSFWGVSPEMAVLACLAMGAAVGAFNGVLIAYWGMPAFIVTLAGLSIWRGTGHLATAAQATPQLPELFNWFGRANPLSGLRSGYREEMLPEFLMPLGRMVDGLWMEYLRTFQMSTVLFLLYFLALILLVANTRYGLYVYAIGSNEPGARQAGINTRAYKLLTYVICSMSAALGALMFLGRAPYAKSDYGMMWELDAIAAVVIGGTSLFGGRGTLIGTLMGVILLKLIGNGLTLAQLDTFWQMVVLGLIILVAVGIDIVRQSGEAEAVRRMLAAVASVMAFFTFLTPGAAVIGGWVALRENATVMALREAGERLAASHQARQLSPEQVAAAEAAIAANLWPAVGFLALTALSLLLVRRGGALLTLGMAGLFAAMVVPLLALGYGVAAPLMVLGAVVLVGAAMTPAIFRRAREMGLDETALTEDVTREAEGEAAR